MKTTITEHDFTEAFRQVRPDNFSYEGLRHMFEAFEELDEDCGTETELDVIAICCEFSEYTADELIEYYSVHGFREELGSFKDWRLYGDREADKLAEWLENQTFLLAQFVNADGEPTFIFADF